MYLCLIYISISLYSDLYLTC